MQAKSLFCLNRKMVTNLNIKETFNVAVDFLDKFYKQNKSDDFRTFSFVCTTSFEIKDFLVSEFWY